MTADEYTNLPIDDIKDLKRVYNVGDKYRIKSNRTFKQGDFVFYYEVENVKTTDYGRNYEAALKSEYLE